MTQSTENKQCVNCPELSKSKNKRRGEIRDLKNLIWDRDKTIKELKTRNRDLALQNRKLRGINAREKVCPVCEETFIAEHGNRKLCDKCRNIGGGRFKV